MAMIGVKEHTDPYLAAFAKVKDKLAGNGQPWLRDVRQAAIDRFAELGFPTPRHEEWKYTNVAPIAKADFRPAGAVDGLTVESFRHVLLADIDAPRLVFVNGWFSPDLSRTGDLAKGVRVGSLRDALNAGGTLVENHLARYAAFQDHAFVALNTAFLNDGAFVEIPKGLTLEQPVLLFFLSTGGEQPAVTHPRNLIIAGSQSQASVVEIYATLNGGRHFTNAVTELVAGEGAVVEHYKVESEAETAFHVATMQFEQDRSSTVLTHNVAFGGALVRNDVNSVLDGEGAECTLNGLFVTGASQHVDNHTVLDHAKPHCNSREFYKGVLAGKSSGVFNGKIIVRKDAQKTDAIQSNKNLLLSKNAAVNTKPQLEIYADDVRCTHGATVGQLDEDAMFYLRARGIDAEAARDLLTYAFAADVLGRIKVAGIRERLDKELFRRLSIVRKS